MVRLYCASKYSIRKKIIAEVQYIYDKNKWTLRNEYSTTMSINMKWPILVTNDSTNTIREMYWDEDNRLMVLSDNGKTSRYTYNAAYKNY